MAKPLAATKHFRLTQDLRRRVQTMAPGEPIDSVDRIKQQYQVSQATVSQALQRLQREGLIHRPAGCKRMLVCEYRPKALYRVALVRPSWPSPDFDAVARSIVAGGESRGWRFDTHVTADDLTELDLERVLGDADGGVFLSSRDRLPDHVASALVGTRRPTVCALEVPALQGVSGVNVNDLEVGRLATQHLLDRGHRQIVCVISEPPSRSIRERAEGFRTALQTALKLDPAQLDDRVIACGVRYGQNSIQVTHQAFRQWLMRSDRPRVTGVVCVAWTGALAVMTALREVGNWQTPGDVSVITYAGESLHMPYLNPPLSAVEADMGAYGRAVIDLLQERLTDATAGPRHLRIGPRLVVRQSTIPVQESVHPYGV